MAGIRGFRIWFACFVDIYKYIWENHYNVCVSTGRVIDWTIDFLKTASGASQVYDVDYTSAFLEDNSGKKVKVCVYPLFVMFSVFGLFSVCNVVSLPLILCL